MERFSLESKDPLGDRVDALRAQFPDAFADGALDLETLGNQVGGVSLESSESFGLGWPGKSEAVRAIQRPSLGALLPMRGQSEHWERTQNVIIEGENLESLKLLQKAYHAKIKVIYIDPPYNTGNEFIYPDNFSEGLADYLRYSGQVDASGQKLTASVETSGRRHSKWLSMMYPRLFLARNLLAEDGVLLVSIDDNEVHHLRSVLNEIFGEENFVGCFVWQAKKGGGGDVDGVVADHEYVLCYARSAETSDLGRIAIDRAPLDRTDEKGPFRRGRELNKWGSNSQRSDRPTMFFPIPGPDGQDVFPIRTDGREGCWRKGRPEMMRLVDEGEIDFAVRSDGRLGAFEKIRGDGPGSKPFRTWLGDVGTTASGTKRVKDLFAGETPFPYPKPVDLVRRLLELGIGDSEDPIAMDFFAGSGTLADAVLQHNWETGASVRYLLVQLPEPTSGHEFNTIGDIARERARRAAQAIESSPRPLQDPVAPDHGFRAFRLGESSFRPWGGQNDGVDSDRLELFDDGVAEGAETDAIVLELLLKSGFELTVEVIEVEIQGLTVHTIGGQELVVIAEGSLTLEIVEAVVEMEPSLILVLDRCFGDDDELKVNTVQTIRAANQGSGTSITLKVV